MYFVNTFKSFCLKDRGGLGNEGSPILLKIYKSSPHVDLCFSFQGFFAAEFWISVK